MLSGLAGISPMKPSHAGYPLPGVQPILVNQNGQEILENEEEENLIGFVRE